MATLKISIPLSGDTKADRQNFVIKIHSIAEWRRALNIRSQRKLAKPSELTGTPLDAPNAKQQVRQLEIVNRQQRMDQEENTPLIPESLEIFRSNASGSDGGSSTSRWSHSTVSDDEEQSANQSVQLDLQDQEIARNRAGALESLEGISAYYQTFDDLIRAEEIRKRNLERKRIGDNLISFIGQRTLSRTPTAGWPFLRSIIINSLDEEGVGNLPPEFDGQQLYLLKLEELHRGGMGAVSALNLNGSNAEFAKRLQEIEERGWRDVLWIANPESELTFRFEKAEWDGKELDWGHMSMI
ncbi:hypothetical protein G7Z17_g7972 [Cylindrodendrum hubeiense]|uniref:Uncharacterized protein n=1 Tax=Cylindrodendrum hubeiense TaxID=595255 RepID=A0A9P5H9G2_9HYPO|nr:hypothetical protein G7Z17_g7972 [Cylindrodendrum hubeiense]